jgi:ElaB/YqjD/DUF883 family membrane-anchored ribosome-binding protein
VSGPLLTAVGAIVLASLSGMFSLMSSTKANRPAESNAQLAWVKQAQDEATAARDEAREAKTESAAARAESEQTRQQLVRIRREFDAMQDWVDRVVRARDAYVTEHPLDGIEDSGVIRLMRAINGGPHSEQ